MKLTEFKSSGRGRTQRLVLGVADKTHAKDYELRIAGPVAAIKRVFGKSDFSIEIDPHRGVKEAGKELEQCQQLQRENFKRAVALENVSTLGVFKRPERSPEPEKTIFVSLQRLRGEGTFWAIGFPYFLPTGWNILLFPPPVLFLSATVTPATGDQDLFLNMVFGPTIAASTFGGTTPDTVLYPGPAPGFFRLRVFGFAAGFGRFSMIGFS